MPGGYLLLGHAESLMNISTAFKLVHLKHDMVYQRPLESKAGHSADGRTDRESA
jgi:chemotaxis protein methyltransferase CheR